MPSPKDKLKLPRNQLKAYIAPGVWLDQAGDCHFSLPEILDAIDMPDTPENRAWARASIVEQILRDAKANFIYREKPD